MISLRKITKEYKKRVVLNNIDLDFQKGNIYLIKGKSGSGKTTLLNIIGGIISDYKGDYYINNEHISPQEVKKKIKCGYLYQKNLFYKNMTIYDNLSIVNNNKKDIEKLAKIFKVEKLLHKKPTMISSGELQRFGLIRILLLDCDVVILDEPTSNLDSKNSNVFAKFIPVLREKNKIIIIATHKNDFDGVSDYFIYLDNCKVITKDNKKKVTNNNNQININEKGKNWFKLVFKNIYSESIISRILNIFLVTSIFVCLSFLKNYKDEFITHQGLNNNYNIIDVEKDDLEKIDKTYKIKKVYENYAIKANNYYVLPLLDKSESPFLKENAIFLGKNPENNNEVLINSQYYKQAFTNNGKVDYSDFYNKKVIIDNQEYSVSGIVGEDNIDYHNIYNNLFYEIVYKDRNYIMPTIFMNYSEISKHTSVINSHVLVSFEDSDLKKIYNKSDINQDLFSTSNYYLGNQNKLYQTITSAESSTKAALLATIMIIIFTVCFIINIISLKISNKHKEIGNLLLLNYTKNDVEFVIIFEFLINSIINIIISILFYYLIMLKIWTTYGIALTLNFIYIIIITLMMVIYNYILIIIGMSKTAKKSILELINE